MNNEEWRATKKKESHDDSPSSSVWNVPASQRLFCLIWSWLKTIPSKINSTRSRLQSSATNQHTHDWHDICTRVEWNGMDPQPLILCYCSATRSAGRRAWQEEDLSSLFGCSITSSVTTEMRIIKWNGWIDEEPVVLAGTQVTVVVAIHNRHE